MKEDTKNRIEEAVYEFEKMGANNPKAISLSKKIRKHLKIWSKSKERK